MYGPPVGHEDTLRARQSEGAVFKQDLVAERECLRMVVLFAAALYLRVPVIVKRSSIVHTF